MQTVSETSSVELSMEIGPAGVAAQTVTEMIAVAWMELTMFCVAAAMYGVLTGKLPGLTSTSREKKELDKEPKLSDEERIVRDLQIRLGENNHHAAFKLWQHVKSLDSVPVFDLAGVVRSMRALGKTNGEVLAELRSRLEGNASIADGVNDLLEALRREGAIQLLDGVVKCLVARNLRIDARTCDALMTWHTKRGNFEEVCALGERCQELITTKMRIMLIGAALRRSRLDDALQHMRLLPRKTVAGSAAVTSPQGNANTLPQSMVARLLALAAREQRFHDAIQPLKDLEICLEAQSLDELLQEASRRQDTLMRQQLYQLAGRPEPAPCEESPEDLAQQVKMIKTCGEEKNLQGAVRVFDRLKQKGVQMNALIYNCLIDACVQCRDTAAALEYFEQMKQLGFADVVSYNTMLKAHLALGHFTEAQALLQEMAQHGHVANSITYNEFLSACVAARDRRTMWSIIDQMRAAGTAPNAATCSILLRSLTEHSHTSDVQRAMQLMDDMQEPVDEVLFSLVVEVCIRIGRLDRLTEIMQKHEKHATLPTLTAPAYGSMIKAYGQARDLERVWALWREMRSRGVNPTAITVGCTVNALVKGGEVEEAWKLVQELVKDESLKQHVNTVIYSTILKGFVLSKQPQRVFVVHGKMRESGTQCNTITYNTMIDACARCGIMDKVPALLEEMKAGCVEPDIITYSTIVKGYCQSGDIGRAFEVLTEMKGDGKYTPDEIMYNSLLDGCAKHNLVQDALWLLEDMKENGVSPSNYTLSITVKLMGRARRLNQAFSIVEETCAAHGFRPNVHVYTSLVQACIQNRKLDRAVGVHETMIEESGCQPDEKFYSALVRGCLQAGSLEKAVAVVRCAYHLPGSNLVKSRGTPVGVESRVLDELFAKLKAGGASDHETAAALLAELRSDSRPRAQPNLKRSSSDRTVPQQ